MSANGRPTPPTRNSTGPILPKRLAQALSVLSETLPNPWDESTDYFTPFAAELADDQPLGAETLRHALQIGDRYQIDLAAVDLTATGVDFGDETAAQGFHLVDLVMKATLSEITRVTARAHGVVRVRTWVLGRFKPGWLIGLRTESTET